MTAYTIVRADDVDDHYAGTSVPGEFRSLRDALGAEQLALTLIRIPPHSDFEQGTGHYHHEIEEIYIVTRGTLTMRFGDAIERSAPDGGPRRTRNAAIAPQRGRQAGRDVGRVAPDRRLGRGQARRLLGGLARRRAGAAAGGLTGGRDRRRAKQIGSRASGKPWEKEEGWPKASTASPR